MARILLLGGLDPSGGAGLTLDATVVKFLGADPLPVALATTVQGLRGFVRCAAIEDELLDEQVATVLADGHVHAVKVGLVASPRQVAVVAELLRRQLGGVPIVVDPVLSATAGGMVANDELVAAYREHLVPLAALVTPNVPELEALAQGDATALLGLGAKNVLAKGGHAKGPKASDTLFAQLGEVHDFERQRFACGPVRGTGCALASAIATHFANGRSMFDACALAGDWLNRMLQQVKPQPNGLPQHLPLDPGVR